MIDMIIRPALRRPAPAAARSRVRRGFTLVEALATITVLAVIGTVASLLIAASADSYLESNTAAQIHVELSIAMDRTMREITSIGLDTAASGVAPDIDSVSATDIQWNATNDQVVLSGTDLNLKLSGTTALLLGDVSAFVVQTYDESNTALGATLSGTGCDAIRRVELTITVDRSGVSQTLRSRIFLRATMAGA